MVRKNCGSSSVSTNPAPQPLGVVPVIPVLLETSSVSMFGGKLLGNVPVNALLGARNTTSLAPKSSGSGPDKKLLDKSTLTSCGAVMLLGSVPFNWQLDNFNVWRKGEALLNQPEEISPVTFVLLRSSVLIGHELHEAGIVPEMAELPN